MFVETESSMGNVALPNHCTTIDQCSKYFDNFTIDLLSIVKLE